MTTHKLEAGSVEAVAKGLQAKHYIAEAQKAFPQDAVTPKISNIVSYLNDLVNIAPRNEYFAGNAIVTSLGYTIINQILWAFRKSQAALNTPAPSIDIFNDGFGEQYETRATEDQMEGNGMAQLPAFNALALKGVYKSLLRMQVGNIAFSADFPVRMPHEILHEMLTKENDELIAKAYAAQSAKEIEQSRAAAAIGAEMLKQATAQKVRNASKNKIEMDHVLDELQKTMPDQMTDDKWDDIPLWMQYKLTCSVFKQVVKAIAIESRSQPEGSHTRDRLLDLIDVMQLELEAAYNSAEVRLAFALERLDERHEVIVKKKKAVVETATV
jgi:hypothetical protein